MFLPNKSNSYACQNRMRWFDFLIAITEARVQVAYEPSAPLNFSTPFCENRYQKIAYLAEWCFFFCDIFPKYKDLIGVYINSCVLYGKVTAFAYTIRAPPSEI